MWTTPEKHTKRRDTLGNANQNKTITRAEHKVSEKNNQRQHSELKEPREMLNKTKTLRTITRQKKALEKALKWTSQTGKEPYKNHSEKKRSLQNDNNNNKKTTKKKSSDRRRTSCKLQEQSWQNAKKSKTAKTRFSQKKA